MLNINVEVIERWKRTEKVKVKKQINSDDIAKLYNQGYSVGLIRKTTGAEMGVIISVLRRFFNYKTFKEQYDNCLNHSVEEQKEYINFRKLHVVRLYKEGWLFQELSVEVGLKVRAIEKILYIEGCITELSTFSYSYKRSGTAKRNQLLLQDLKSGMTKEDVMIKYEVSRAIINNVLGKLYSKDRLF